MSDTPNKLEDFKDGIKLLETIADSYEYDAVITKIEAGYYLADIYGSGITLANDGSITNESTTKDILAYTLYRGDKYSVGSIITLKLVNKHHALILPPRLPERRGKYTMLMQVDDNKSIQFERPRFVDPQVRL